MSMNIAQADGRLNVVVYLQEINVITHYPTRMNRKKNISKSFRMYNPV